MMPWYVLDCRACFWLRSHHLMKFHPERAWVCFIIHKSTLTFEQAAFPDMCLKRKHLKMSWLLNSTAAVNQSKIGCTHWLELAFCGSCVLWKTHSSLNCLYPSAPLGVTKAANLPFHYLEPYMDAIFCFDFNSWENPLIQLLALINMKTIFPQKDASLGETISCTAFRGVLINATQDAVSFPVISKE